MPILDKHKNIVGYSAYSLRPNRIIQYNKWETSPVTKTSETQENKLPKYNSAGGLISKQAEKSIKDAINWLLFCSKSKSVKRKKDNQTFQFKLNFITLTLPAKQFHDDNFVKAEMLDPFLDNAKKTWDIVNYVWRAESQENGNIHFHIILDKYVHWGKIRKTWNHICKRHGYIENYRIEQENWHSQGFKVREDLVSKWSIAQQFNAYENGKKTNWTNPNSTDIHSIKKIGRLADELSKYSSKNTKGAVYQSVTVTKEGTIPIYNPSQVEKANVNETKMYRTIGGKIWGLSHTLSKMKACVIDELDTLYTEIEKIFWRTTNKIVTLEYCSILFCDLKEFLCFHNVHIRDYLYEWCEKIMTTKRLKIATVIS